MQQNQITILFVISTAKTNQKGLSPLYCRITLNKIRKQFSTGLFVNPKNWNNKIQKVTTADPQHKHLNKQIEQIQKKLVLVEVSVPCSVKAGAGLPVGKTIYYQFCAAFPALSQEKSTVSRIRLL